MTTRTWAEIRADMLSRLSPEERARWEKTVRAAVDRYLSEIRRYRGIHRIRKMYRVRRR